MQLPKGWCVMARYRKVSTVIWNDAKFRTLTDDSQLLFLFILTHPHMTSLGAMRTTIDGLAAEKSWKRERLLKAFNELANKGLVKYDERASCLLVPNFIKHNEPESPNVIKSWDKSLEMIPECSLKIELCESMGVYVAGLGEGFRKAFESLGEGFGKGMPYQEQEQEQEQEQDTPKPPDQALEFMATWNATKGVRPIRKLGSRATALKARLRDPDWDWRAALAKFPLRCFAADPTGFVPDLEFFIRPDTVNKILEGKYDWEKAGTAKALPPPVPSLPFAN
jgi:hypothetical protein